MNLYTGKEFSAVMVAMVRIAVVFDRSIVLARWHHKHLHL